MKYKIFFLSIHFASAMGVEYASIMQLVTKSNSSDFKTTISKFKNINMTVDDLGRTLLHHAVANNKIDRVELLLDAGADINAPDNSGETPLHHAAFMAALHCKRNPIKTECNDRIKIIYLLLNNGADINVQDDTGDTALHAIMRIASVPVTKALLDYFPDVNIQNKKGKTPLRILMQKHIYIGDPDIARVKELLLEAGANPAIIDLKARSCLSSPGLANRS